MKRTIWLVAGGLLIAAAAFAGGYLLAGRLGGGMSGGGPNGGQNNAFAQLTSAEREQLSTMSDSERQEFFKEKGIDMSSSGGQGGPGGGQGGSDNGQGAGGASANKQLEGVISAIDDDKATLTLASGGTATFYFDDSTTVAAVEGKTAAVTKGASVLVYTQQEAEGVDGATVVIVK